MDEADQQEIFSPESIRRALRACDSVQALGEHPLARLSIVCARQQAEGYSDTPAGRGLALQGVLRAAVESLRPGDATPDPTDKRWRPHIILVEQYLQGRSPDWVAAQLHVSRRTYYNEQEQAMQAVADVLCKWEEQSRQKQPAAVGRHTPFLAPPRPAHALMGREGVLGALKSRLLHNPGVLIALQGLPGVGKTAIAIELAHAPDVLAHFCDGVLWAGLGREPDAPALLGAWAAALGVPSNEIAQQADSIKRAQLVHAAIGLGRMLLVIDDAWQVESALAFKVGGPNCAYLVTTRLPNVALDLAGEGAVQMQELGAADGLGLLAQLAPQAVEAEPEGARSLVQAVGGLPLALILMGRHLRKQAQSAPTRRLRQALARLHEAQTRLKLAQPQSPLERYPDLPPDASLSLQALISISDATLDAPARRALRDLALFLPKPNTFSEEAALAVTAAPVDALDALVDCGLLESVGADRYTLHQTIADYAQVDSPDPQACQRLARYWAQYAQEHTADDALLDRERDNLLTALHMAFDHRLDDELVRGVGALHPFLLRRGLTVAAETHLSRALDLMPDVQANRAGRYTLLLAREKAYQLQGKRQAQDQDLSALQELAGRENNTRWRAEVSLRRASAAHAISDYPAIIAAAQQAVELAQAIQAIDIQAGAHQFWGQALILQGEHNAAREQLERALALAQTANLPQVAADSLCSLGQATCEQSDYALAYTCLEQALRLYREIGDRVGESRTLSRLGYVAYHQCDYAASQAFHTQVLQLYRQAGSRRGESTALLNLGAIISEQGDPQAGSVYQNQALQISREIRARNHEALALNNLGVNALRLGDYAGARSLLDQAMQLFSEMGDRHSQIYALLDLSLLFHQLGDDAAALKHCQQALPNIQETGDRYEHARALTCQGRALAGLGRMEEAADAFAQSLALRLELKQSTLAAEPLAGLARIALERGDLAQALARVEDMLARVEKDKALTGTDEPIRIYLTCYRVLHANSDPRAPDVLKAAFDLLQERAALIPDEAARRAFLENVPANRELQNEHGAGT